MSLCAVGLDQTAKESDNMLCSGNSNIDMLFFGSRVPEQQCRHAEGCRFESAMQIKKNHEGTACRPRIDRPQGNMVQSTLTDPEKRGARCLC